MHLAIDLRFYRPEPYGLAVHIRDLFTELVPILERSKKCSKVTLILDQSNAEVGLADYLPWWDRVVESETFEVIFSPYRYYSWGEQLGFYDQLNHINPDLTFFFTFNFPIRYNKLFVYQVLDLSIPKTRSLWNPKVQAMLFCMRAGLKKAEHVFFLGENTLEDAQRFSSFQFREPQAKGYRPNTILFNGLNPAYSNQFSSNKQKADTILSLEYRKDIDTKSQVFLDKHSITKPYLLYTSVWRPYKNHKLLAEAFNTWNKKGEYQLVLAGRIDPQHKELFNSVQDTEGYKQGNIISLSDLTDEEMIFLQDKAQAFVAPPSSEGFGLWLVEAAVRGTPVICNNIKVFRDLCHDGVLYFEENTQSIIQALDTFVSSSQVEIDQRSKLLHQYTAQYRWNAVAKSIYEVIEQKLVSYE